MLTKISAAVPREFVQGNIYPAARTGQIDPLRTQEAPQIQPVFMVVAVDLCRAQKSPAGRARMRRNADPDRFVYSIDSKNIFNASGFYRGRAGGKSMFYLLPALRTISPAFALVIPERTPASKAASIKGRVHRPTP
jgi:hypothetical protein